jgi:hypothetical protein
MFGSQLIMTDDILERLVELAHFGQVSDLVSIHTRLSWRYTDLWGTQVLDIIKKHFPPIEPVAPRPALQPAGPSTVHRPSDVLSTAPQVHVTQNNHAAR